MTAGAAPPGNGEGGGALVRRAGIAWPDAVRHEQTVARLRLAEAALHQWILQRMAPHATATTSGMSTVVQILWRPIQV